MVRASIFRVPSSVKLKSQNAAATAHTKNGKQPFAIGEDMQAHSHAQENAADCWHKYMFIGVHCNSPSVRVFATSCMDSRQDPVSAILRLQGTCTDRFDTLKVCQHSSAIYAGATRVCG